MLHHRYNLNGSRDARRGFTLIELLVVIVILGVLTAIAVPIYLNQRVVAWKTTVTSDVHNAAEQVELASYHGDGSLTHLSSYHATPGVATTATAADTSETDDMIKYTRSNTNTDGTLARSMMIGSQRITISPSNKITLTVFTNNKYRIVGEQPSNLKGWQYVYESDKGTGEWVSPAAANDDIGVRAVMYTESVRIPVYRLATDDETAKINSALADGSATLPTADDEGFPAGRLSSWDSAHFMSNARSFGLIIKDGSRYYLGGNNLHIDENWGRKLKVDPTTKDYTFNTPIDYVNNSSYDHDGYPDVKVPAIQNADTINDAIWSLYNDERIMQKITTTTNAPLNISDSGKKVTVNVGEADDVIHRSITVKNMSTTKAHTLHYDGNDKTILLQPDHSTVVDYNMDLTDQTLSDDTGFSMSIHVVPAE